MLKERQSGTSDVIVNPPKLTITAITAAIQPLEDEWLSPHVGSS